MHLLQNSLLQGGKYRIERVLGQGGFGITYLAEQVYLGRKVAIKEFFMKQFCNRDTVTPSVTVLSESCQGDIERFKNKFIKEARITASLDCTNIVRIHDIFEENDTAYYVMEYIDGESLSTYIHKYGAMSEIQAIMYIKQVARALDHIHTQKINHLDVKPANVLIRNNTEMVLIDFGISKRYDSAGGQTNTLPVGISHGYAPMEQYNQNGVGIFCPATDIYALGATLYKLITGNTPPVANIVYEDGLTEFPDHISETTKNAIISAMKPNRKQRPQNIAEFIALLNCNEFSEAETTELAEEDDFDYNDLIIDVAEANSDDENPNNFEETQIAYDDEDIPTITEEEENRIIQLKDKRKNINIVIGIGILIGAIIGEVIAAIIACEIWVYRDFFGYFRYGREEEVILGVIIGAMGAIIGGVIGGVIEIKKTFTKKDYKAMGNPNRLVIPKYFTSIRYDAFFANANNLTAIVIPNSVKTVYNYTFRFNENLTIYISPTSPVYKKYKEIYGDKVVEI